MLGSRLSGLRGPARLDWGGGDLWRGCFLWVLRDFSGVPVLGAPAGGWLLLWWRV